MNLPNKLTLLRIILTFVFMIFLFCKGILAKSLALLAFSLASSTDFYDGHIARKRAGVTDFGKLMDPIADKILVLGAFLAFVELRLVPAWMVVLIITRELLITGLRIFAITKGKVLAASMGGKHKTASQLFCIFSILAFLIFREIGKQFSFWGLNFEAWMRLSILSLMGLTVILTLSSGISYLWRNRVLFS